MKHNPDIYLLYEYMKKIAYTVRIKVTLREPVDSTMLNQAAQEAIRRFPYFAVSPGLDKGENIVLRPNANPIAVLPEENARLVLGSDKVGGHLFAITWRDRSIWFNFSHSVCGAYGAMFWVKCTLYQYLTRKHGAMKAPGDLKAADSPVDPEEYAYPEADKLPTDEPLSRYTGGNSKVGLLGPFLRYLLNPFVKNNYYYEIEIPSREFMEVARRLDASPNSLVTAMLLRAAGGHFPPKKGEHISCKIADDYRADVGCPKAYRDFVRFIHVRYDWTQGQETVEKLNMRARGAILAQKAPELSYEVFRTAAKAHEGIDAQPDLKAKKKYAAAHSTFRTDVRDTCTVSYVGQTDWGGMADYIDSVYTITDGNLVVEINALPDKFCLSFQMMLSGDRGALDVFCRILKEYGLPFTLTEQMPRYLPDIRLP